MPLWLNRTFKNPVSVVQSLQDHVSAMPQTLTDPQQAEQTTAASALPNVAIPSNISADDILSGKVPQNEADQQAQQQAQPQAAVQHQAPVQAEPQQQQVQQPLAAPASAPATTQQDAAPITNKDSLETLMSKIYGN